MMRFQHCQRPFRYTSDVVVGKQTVRTFADPRPNMAFSCLSSDAPAVPYPALLLHIDQ